MARSVKQLPIMHRTFEVSILRESAGDEPGGDPKDQIGQGRLYEVAISSEEPATQWYWELGLVKETLSHKKAAVLLDRLEKAGPVLWNHDRYDQIGRIFEPRILEGKLVGSFRYSRTQRGQEFELDGVDGIKVNVSVGYRVLEMKLTRRGDVESGEIDEYLVTKWEPYEVSIVSIPADVSVGLGRQEAEELARRSGGETFPAEIEDGDAVREEIQMKTKEELAADAALAAAAAAPPAPTVTAEARDAEVLEIVGMARENGMEHLVDEWVRVRRLNPAQVAHEIVKARAATVPAQPAPRLGVGVPERDRRHYSYARAIMGALALREGGRFDGIEREVHDELRKNLPPLYPAQGGVMVPLALNERALDSKTIGKGAELVADQPGELIEMLRNRSVVSLRGARTLTGLGAPIPFPRQKTGMTFYWMGENPAAAVATSDVGLGVSILAPKTLMGSGSFSRQLLAIGNSDVEAMLRDEIAIGHALAVDRAAIHGIGAAGEPTGIYNATDVNSLDINAVPTFALLVNGETEVGKDNADLGNMGWITTPGMAGKMRQTLVASAAGSDMIWRGNMRDGEMAGYPASASNNVSSVMASGAVSGGSEHGLIFGNWADLIIGMFSGLEILVDPYTDAGKAMIRITSFQLADILARHGESFAKYLRAVIA